jgi:DNA polymerase III gamma/tau subunit
MEEIYKRHRPKTFKGMVGQAGAIKTLKTWVSQNRIPHAVLLTGASGCGKTTTARILKTKLDCGDADYCEINAADFRGIDTIREIDKRMRLAPISGKHRMWVIDECHKLTNDAQNAILKMLEDTPRHVYFLLLTTDPGKLLKTIITRCTEVRFQSMPPDDLTALVEKVVAAEGATIGAECIGRIVEVADGSARKALVLLEQVIGMESDEERIKVILSSDIKQLAINIAKGLIGRKPWKELAPIVKGCEEEPESIRRLVLGYASAVLLNSGMPRAAFVLSAFRDHWYECGKAGLVLACWEVCQMK